MAFFIFIFVFPVFCPAQEKHIIKTDDGKRVLLKTDFTWEYIDLDKPITVNAVVDNSKKSSEYNFIREKGFKEPKLDTKIQSKLKRGHATIDDVKRKVAKDYYCTADEVLLLSLSKQKEKAVYHFCANGKEIAYKPIGNFVIKKAHLFQD